MTLYRDDDQQYTTRRATGAAYGARRAAAGHLARWLIPALRRTLDPVGLLEFAREELLRKVLEAKRRERLNLGLHLRLHHHFELLVPLRIRLDEILLEKLAPRLDILRGEKGKDGWRERMRRSARWRTLARPGDARPGA